MFALRSKTTLEFVMLIHLSEEIEQSRVLSEAKRSTCPSKSHRLEISAVLPLIAKNFQPHDETEQLQFILGCETTTETNLRKGTPSDVNFYLRSMPVVYQCS